MYNVGVLSQGAVNLEKRNPPTSPFPPPHISPSPGELTPQTVWWDSKAAAERGFGKEHGKEKGKGGNACMDKKKYHFNSVEIGRQTLLSLWIIYPLWYNMCWHSGSIEVTEIVKPEIRNARILLIYTISISVKASSFAENVEMIRTLRYKSIWKVKVLFQLLIF